MPAGAWGGLRLLAEKRRDGEVVLVMLDTASIYVIHGWKVEGEVMEKCLMNLSPAVIEIGLHLVFPKTAKYSFLGEILGKAEEGSQFAALRVIPPAPEAATRVMSGLELMGIKKGEVGAPLLWVVAG